MHLLDYKISIIFLFCNAEMAKFELITFKTLQSSIWIAVYLYKNTKKAEIIHSVAFLRMGNK